MPPLPRIGLIGADPFGPRLAGPALRSWHLARVLAEVAQVTLFYEGTPPAPPAGVTLEPLRVEAFPARGERLDGLLVAAQAMLKDRRLFQVGCPLVVDCYDPFPLETAALLSEAGPAEVRYRTALQAWASLAAVAAGDYWLVGGEHQRLYLAGLLVGAGRMTPALSQADESAHPRTLVAPFGHDDPSARVTPAMSAAIESRLKKLGIERRHRVLLWTGGLWRWLDPELVVAAFTRLADQLPTSHLVLPGVGSPNAQSPEGRTIARLRGQVAKSPARSRIHLMEWVEADLWPALAARATVHVSAHRAGWEAWGAVRTRYLEAIAHGVPLVATMGDPLGAQLAQMGLAQLAPCGDAEGYAEVLLGAVAQAVAYQHEGPPPEWRDLAARYRWEATAAPLCLAVAAGLTRSERDPTQDAIRSWVETYPIPPAPSGLAKLWDRYLGGR